MPYTTLTVTTWNRVIEVMNHRVTEVWLDYVVNNNDIIDSLAL